MNLRSDENYWQKKLAAFLHDPPDKVLGLRDHIGRSRELIGELYLTTAEEHLIKKADMIAAGLDRAFLPGKDEGGLVDFIKSPVITHPTSKAHLTMKNSFADTSKDLITLLEDDENQLPRTQPLRSAALFHYFRHILPYRLASSKAGNLSWEWIRLPADSRIPDHTIWQHCALTSALYSCYELSPERKAAVMVFSIVPVQDFIARSRKLRDHWTASLILSWLSSEAMKAVILRYGSDHIIYPWPVGQPLVELFLDILFSFPRDWKPRYSLEIRAATLPNKIVFLVPAGEEKEAAEFVQKSVSGEWKKVAEETKDLVVKKCFRNLQGKVCLEAFERIFDRQVDSFWEYHWAAGPLLTEQEASDWKDFLPGEVFDVVSEYLGKARAHKLPFSLDENQDTHQSAYYSESFFYSLSHDLAQRSLAATKLMPENLRAEEPGIKCHLHTDLEALRFSCLECSIAGRDCVLNPGRKPDPNPRPSLDPCWIEIRKRFSEKEIKQTERLSAIGLIKRLLYRAVPENHPLKEFFKDAAGFPSTTEVSLSDWLRRNDKRIRDAGLKPREVAEIVHRQDSAESEKNEIETVDDVKTKRVLEIIQKASEDDPVHNVDRYYALLVMDGDNMGKLLAGGFSSEWRDVFHPEIVKRLEAKRISKIYQSFWHEIVRKEENKTLMDENRMLSPSVHGAISQALSEYALNTVPRIVKKHSGWLIYAGGDDVCAVFPVSTAVRAARELAEAYNWAFVRLNNGTVAPIVSDDEISEKDRLLVHLGEGKDISISAGLFMAHHKWPLRAAISRAHELLEDAKHKGRAAMSLSLQKRAGGERLFTAGFKDTFWEEVKVWDSFEKLVEAIARKEISSSVIYDLAELEPALLNLEVDKKSFLGLIASRLEKSKVKPMAVALNELALHIAVLLLGGRSDDENKESISTEVIEIAHFVAEAVRRNKAFV
ncbi:MAG: type III-B CRISPR-associated protein Cas10/Cmr2 [Thermodesulforhabdaceae bacterium]